MSTRVVLVNDDGQPTGTADKLQAHTEGWLHRALSVFVFDAEGRLLLQQRNPDKYHSGGLWSNTCCSHPHPDESPDAAARRRLREEMGFACALTPLFHFTYRAPVGDGLTEHEYDHVFVGHVTTADIRPDPDEVTDWAWIAPSALRADVDTSPHRYTVWFQRLLDPVLVDARSPVSAEAPANPSR
jgi:isopentenyl-diphosphate delta-isomerase